MLCLVGCFFRPLVKQGPRAMERFNTISIKHFYHELNGMVDELSRRAVGDIEGLLGASRNLKINSGSLRLY